MSCETLYGLQCLSNVSMGTSRDRAYRGRGVIATDRFWGELTLGDTIAFAVIIGGLIVAALFCLVGALLDMWKSRGRRHSRDRDRSIDEWQ
jgi:hypothetical protein